MYRTNEYKDVSGSNIDRPNEDEGQRVCHPPPSRLSNTFNPRKYPRRWASHVKSADQPIYKDETRNARGDCGTVMIWFDLI